jgi:hypothetical protein
MRMPHLSSCCYYFLLLVSAIQSVDTTTLLLCQIGPAHSPIHYNPFTDDPRQTFNESSSHLIQPCLQTIQFDSSHAAQITRLLRTITSALIYTERAPSWYQELIKQIHAYFTKLDLGDPPSRALVLLHAGKNDSHPLHLLQHTQDLEYACLGLFQLYLAAWYPVRRTVGASVIHLAADLCTRAVETPETLPTTQTPPSYALSIAAGMLNDMSASMVTNDQDMRDRLWASKMHYARARVIVETAQRFSLPFAKTLEARMKVDHYPPMKFRHSSFSQLEHPEQMLNAIADFRLGHRHRAQQFAVRTLQVVSNAGQLNQHDPATLTMAQALLVAVQHTSTSPTTTATATATATKEAHHHLFRSNDHRLANSHMLRITDHYSTYFSEEKVLFSTLMKGKSFWLETFVLPDDRDLALRQARTRNSWWIKPLASDLGRGHGITNPEGLIALANNHGTRLIAQRHIARPCLLGFTGGPNRAVSRHKFSIRVFALVVSFQPLVVYVSDEAGDLTMAGAAWVDDHVVTLRDLEGDSEEEYDDVGDFDRSMHISNYQSKLPQQLFFKDTTHGNICGDKTAREMWADTQQIMLETFTALSTSPVLVFPKGKEWMPRLVGVDLTVDSDGNSWLHELHWTAEPDSRLLGFVYQVYHRYLETGKMDDPRFHLLQ